MARTKDQSFVNRYLNQYQQNQKSAVSAGQQAASNAASSGVQQMNATGNIEIPSLYDPTEELYGLVLEQQQAQIKAQQAAAKAAQKAQEKAQKEAQERAKEAASESSATSAASNPLANRLSQTRAQSKVTEEEQPKKGLLSTIGDWVSEGLSALSGSNKDAENKASTSGSAGVPARSLAKTAAVERPASAYDAMTVTEKLTAAQQLSEQVQALQSQIDALERQKVEPKTGAGAYDEEAYSIIQKNRQIVEQQDALEARRKQLNEQLSDVDDALWADPEYINAMQTEITSKSENERIAQYLDPSYKLNKLEEEDAREIIKRYRKEAADTAWWFSGATDEQRKEALDKELIATDLETKVSDLYAFESNFAFSVPGVEAVTNAVVKAHKGDDYDPNEDSVQAFLDPIRKQSPIASTAGSVGGTLASYAAGSAAARSIPALQRVGQAAAATPAAQAIQKIPVLGRLGTADAITGIYGDTLVDLALDTVPRLGNDILAYNQQQDVINQGLSAGKTMDEIIPSLEEYQGEYLTPGGIAADTLKGIGTNLAFNLGGELVPELLKAGGRNLHQALVPSLDAGADAARIAQGSVDEAAQAAYNEVTNGGVYNGSQAVDDARRAVASNPANGAGSGGNGGQSQFGRANGAGPDFRPGEAGAFAPGDIPPERVTNPDLETAFDLTSAERAAAANSGKDLRSSTTRNIKALYDDFDSGRISSADFSARAREIARTMVNEDDFTFTNMDDALREVRNVAKGQKLYVGDTELNELLSVSGAKSLSDFNRRFGTQLTRDRQYIALDQIDNELYWRYAGGTDTNPAEAFWSVVDGIKGNGAKSFDQAGYDEAVDYYRDLIERFDRYQREPGSVGVEYAAYVDDIPSLYQPYGANADLSINDLPESMLNDALPSLYDGLPESIGAMRHNPRSYAGMQVEYGTIAPGENAARVVDVPISTNGTDRVSASARTFMEAPQTTDELVGMFEKGVEDGLFSHDVKRDADSLARAVSKVEQDGYQKTLEYWKGLMRDGASLNKEQIVQGQLLYTLAAKNGDTATAMDLAGDLARIATEAGQNLQAQRLLKRMTPEGKLYYARQTVDSFNRQLKQQLGEGFQDIEIPEELARTLMDAKDAKAQNDAMQNIYQYVADQLPADWGTRWNAWRYLAMLSNPATHVRNVLSNAVNVPARKFKNILGAGIERLTLEEGQRTKSIINPLSASDRELVNFAKSDIENVMPQLTGAQKYSDRSAIKQMVDPFKVNGTWGKNADSNILAKGARNAADAVSGGLSSAYKFNSWALGAEDMLFKKGAYVDSLSQYLKANGIDPAKATQKQLDAAREYAVEEALRATYTEFNSMAQALGKVERKNLFTKVFFGGVVPFKSTPFNIIRRGVRYSPVGLMESVTNGVRRLRAGEINANQFIDNISQGLSGTAIFGLGMWLGANGIINGISPENKKEQSLKSSQGWQNYSINLPGGGTYTIDWGGPSVMAILAGVETAKAFEKDGYDFNEVLTALGNITEPMFDTTMLDGVNSAIQSATYAGSNPVTALVSQAASNFVTQAIPSLSGVVARAYDPVRRTAYSDQEGAFGTIDESKQRIMNKVPGLSESNQPYIDVWGREQENPGGSFVGRLAYGLLSPGYYSPDRSTIADSVVEGLYETTGDSGTLPGSFNSSVTVDGEKIKLSPENYTLAKQTKGQASKQMIESLYEYPQYNAMDAEMQADVVKGVYDLANDVAKYQVIPSLYDGLVSEIESGDASKSETLAAMYLTGGAEQVIPYLVADELTSDVRADKNAKGNSIPGSKEKNFIETLMQNGYTRGDAGALYQLLK